MKSGLMSDDIYKPTLWYFHLFDFIGDQDVPRSSRSNISDGEKNDSNDANNPTENSMDKTNVIYEMNTTDDAAAANTRTIENITPKKAQVLATRPGKKKIDQDQLTNDELISVRYHFKSPALI